LAVTVIEAQRLNTDNTGQVVHTLAVYIQLAVTVIEAQRLNTDNPGQVVHTLAVYIQLAVTVIEAQRLPATNSSGTCDPYVRLLLLPAKKPSFTTAVQHNSTDPQFLETFTFEASYRHCLLA